MIVEAFKRIISKKIDIRKMILFGSRAGRDFKNESDFDLIIVSDEFEGVKSYQRAIKMYRAWDVDYSVDFVCLTSEEFEKMKNRPTVVKLASEGGIEV